MKIKKIGTMREPKQALNDFIDGNNKTLNHSKSN